jgi:PleD family two-component response regulator
VQLAGREFRMTASIGIVVSTPYYQYPEEMLRDADIAMYRAKDTGKARYQIFSPVGDYQA